MKSEDFGARVDRAMAAVFDGLVTGGLKEMRARIWAQLASLDQERRTEIARLGGELSRLGTKFDAERQRLRKRARARRQ